MSEFNMPTLTEYGLEKLSPADRLSLVEVLWDSITDHVESNSLTDAELSELDRRYEESVKYPDATTPWEDIKARALARARK